MTFRTRLVMAATVAVVAAVVMASIAAYVVAHNSLVGSIDVNLTQEGTSVLDQQKQLLANSEYLQLSNVCFPNPVGQCQQIAYAGGTISSNDPQVLPVPDKVKPVAASEPPRTAARLPMVRLVLPESSGKQAEVLGHGAEAAPRVVEILTEIGVIS